MVTKLNRGINKRTKRMKYNVFAFLVLVFITFNDYSLYGQLPDPIKRSTTDFGTINSDYGPRHLSTSPFHNGGLLPLSDTL